MSIGSKNPIGWDKRPARIQIDPELVHGPNKVQSAQTGNTYNIWYNAWQREDRVQLSRQRPSTRVNVETDAGMTMGIQSDIQFICLFFARGACVHGYQCKFWHRLPERTDRFPGIYDVFGRNLFGQLKEDLGGVGSFMKDHRTLFIGRISYDAVNVEEIVARHFGEFGHVVRVKVLTGRGIAFVTYSNAYEAQFAKEAMADQALDNEEMINVRWAGEDPNPRVLEEERRRAEEEARQVIEDVLLPPDVLQHAKERVMDDEDERQQMDAFAQVEDEERPAKKARTEVTQMTLPLPPPSSGGFLDNAAINNLKSLARTIPQGITLTLNTTPPPPKTALDLLDYSSD